VISVSVVEEGGKVIDFWAQKKSKRQVEHAHGLVQEPVQELEAVQAELSTLSN